MDTQNNAHMVTTPPYYAPVTSGAYTYSIDRIQIKFAIDESMRQYLSDNITALKSFIQCLCISEEDTRSYHYRYSCYKNYYDENGNKYANLELKMLQNNTEYDDCCRMIVNPNKFCTSEECMSDFKALMSIVNAYYIEQMDIAIDIPVKKEHVHLLKDKRAKMEFYSSRNNPTEYLGRNRNTIGHVKLYDKQAECKLSGELTRLEITVGNPLEKSWLDAVIKKLPEVMITVPESQGTNLSGNLNDTEKVLVLLLKDHPDKTNIYNMLGYRMKKKLSSYIFASDSRFEYDMDAIQKLKNNIIETIKCKGANIKDWYIAFSETMNSSV